jgi:hypothetical protein
MSWWRNLFPCHLFPVNPFEEIMGLNIF